jgi:ribonucleoside-diphosphate reductase alpha chain
MYEQLSEERKDLQKHCHLPEWVTTGGWQLFKEKYLYQSIGLDDTYERIAKTMAKHTDDPMYWESKFFEVMWNGWLALSTPVLSNGGTPKGHVVSCSGQLVGDSINEFYKSYHETACLTKHGFGTSAYLGAIRPRGVPISVGGTASGVLPVVKHFVQDMRDVAQGTSRRGAWAGYYPLDGGDFWEVAQFLETEPDDLNVGWVVSDAVVEALEAGDKEITLRWQKTMKIRAVLGKGYYFFIDKVNRASPQHYKDLDLTVHASNLCTEITLYATPFETFTCVLSSMNLAKYDEWKHTDAVFVATVFLDCVAQEFVEKAKGTAGMTKAVRFTEKNRALGLGALGFHTYLQQKMIPIESLEAHMVNNEIFAHIKNEAVKASEWMAEEWGEPILLKGTGRRNSHLLAIAPNTSSALICGGVSQGIEPVVANVYNQQTAAGNIYRVNPVFLALAKERVGWTEGLKQSIIDNYGSVQHLDWLTDEEKLVFKTAYEIDQTALLRLASTRQRHICQAQSLNLFFHADEDEGYIADVHKQAFLDENIKSLYYMRTQAGVQASKGECIACEG